MHDVIRGARGREKLPVYFARAMCKFHRPPPADEPQTVKPSRPYLNREVVIPMLCALLRTLKPNLGKDKRSEIAAGYSLNALERSVGRIAAASDVLKRTLLAAPDFVPLCTQFNSRSPDLPFASYAALRSLKRCCLRRCVKPSAG